MSKKYMVELKGIGVVNKGAYLMLLSLLQNLKELHANVEFCTSPNSLFTSSDMSKYGIKTKINFRDKGLPWDTIFKMISKNNLEKYGLVHNKDIDLIVDSSGFAYGDYWGVDYINKRMYNVVSNKIRKDTKLILMPQAYGPFEDRNLKKAFNKIVKRADIIFVRDIKSLNYLESSYGKNNKFIKSPDFTNILDSGKSKKYKEGNICIIPNSKMLYNINSKDKYLSLMISLINHLIDKEESPYFLVHEAEKDIELVKNINSGLKQELSIVSPKNPIVIKNRIKSSKLVIVSRYHGLVSALSQGIPVIATSWSHKYKELMKDYNKEDNLIDIFNYKEDYWLKEIDTILDINLKKYIKDQQNVITAEKEKVNNMWLKIENIINN